VVRLTYSETKGILKGNEISILRRRSNQPLQEIKQKFPHQKLKEVFKGGQEGERGEEKNFFKHKGMPGGGGYYQEKPSQTPKNTVKFDPNSEVGKYPKKQHLKQ